MSSSLRRLWLAFRPDDTDATCIEVAIVWVCGDKILGFEWTRTPDEALIPLAALRTIVLEMPRHLHWLSTVAWPEARCDLPREDRDLAFYLIETLAMAPLFVLRMDKEITMNAIRGRHLDGPGLDEVSRESVHANS